MSIFICGDSTAQTYDPQQTLMVGWGQLLGDFLLNETICNHAMAGRSTKSFLADGRLQALDGNIGPGDLMLIQFAHNDEDEKPERHTMPWTTYSDNLSVFVNFARHRGALPVLVTPICMRVWANGVLQDTHGEYKDAMRALAQKMDVPLLGLLTNEEEVLLQGLDYLRVTSLDYLLTAFVFPLNALCNGSGHTIFTMIPSIVSSVVTRVPVAYFCVRVLDLKILGIVLSTPTGTISAIIICAWFYFSNRWCESTFK